ncbi:MAG: TIGR01210 family radical SAM protein [Candidatus Lokiarchaeota archaeon]|nr:TIGR01210 family radical SAM protein [Candidatus Lokiarchaeota archaeon]
MKKLNEDQHSESSIARKVKWLREKETKHKKKIGDQALAKPVAFWIKEDRLLHEIGREFTIILKTIGCSWARGELGGCSMCGYIRDATLCEIPQKKILTQFNHAFNSKRSDIETDQENNYIMKIFNSGSFFDDKEITEETREYVYQHIAQRNRIKEFVVESRPEYVKEKSLRVMKDLLGEKHIEIGIGLESADDHVRNCYINKGFQYSDFMEAVELCKKNEIGVRAYLLFKPPFLSEQSAIDDCVKSIKKLIELEIDTISINPVNVQRGTLVEYLWFQNRYRPPWYYSLFECLRESLTQKAVKKVRVVSDPSGAGTKRGIHNCLNRDCTINMQKVLHEFVLNQDISTLYEERLKEIECDCKVKYQLEMKYK